LTSAVGFRAETTLNLIHHPPEGTVTMHLHERIVVNRPRADVYAFWRNLTQLPQFMDHLVSVSGDSEGVTHWKAKSPIGTVEWDAQLIQDKPDEMISWRSVEDSEVRNSGAVRFMDVRGGGTEVAVDISFDPPLGILGEIVAKLFGEAPDQQIADDLKRFKEIMESGQAKVSRVSGQAAAGTTDRSERGGTEMSGKREQSTNTAKDELISSRSSTHAASNEPRYERDIDVDDVAVESAGGNMMLGGTAVDNIAYPSTGMVGNMAAEREEIARGEVGPHVRAAGDDAIANDIDPTRRGLRSGKDQNKIDPNDRDAADRGSSVPI
jgi:uncharacterized membrane protein